MRTSEDRDTGGEDFRFLTLTPIMRSSISRAIAALGAVSLIACVKDEFTGPVVASDPTPGSLSIEKIGSYAGGGVGAAEIVAYDPSTARLFTVNGLLNSVDVLDISAPAAPRRVTTINVGAYGLSANSVAVANGVVAVAIEASVKTNPGKVAFYRSSDLTLLSVVTVGALPDMVTFTPDGRTLLVANEGEPSSDYGIDPEGSVSLIDVTNPEAPSVRTAAFTSFNGQEATLRQSGVRIYGPSATAAKDFEPEYIAVSEDGTKAWVTLQENNAIATVDVLGATVTSIRALGFKNHALPQNGIDASDKDGLVNIRSWPVFGMYQPDGIATYTVGGQVYLLTANEGDARSWPAVVGGGPGLVEEARVSTLALNPITFSDSVCGGPCKADARLGRLTVTKSLGFNAVTGVYDSLFVLGARSFSVWDGTTGQLVWDSGSDFEQRTTSLSSAPFNASHDNATFDDRSDNKGPEPEGITLGRFGTKTFAFVGFERVGGVMVYDVTTPTAPLFVTYVNSRSGATGDLGPEGVLFIPAKDSPTRQPLLVTGNEISGTTAIYRIDLVR